MAYFKQKFLLMIRHFKGFFGKSGKSKRPLGLLSKKQTMIQFFPWKKNKDKTEIRKCAEKRAKSQNSAGKFSKTGTFQTAGAAQPIELSKKRRHF